AALCSPAQAAAVVEGQVVDVNGRPVSDAQVVFDRDERAPGASVVTVFTGEDGRFTFPGTYPEATSESVSLTVRALGYEQVDARIRMEGEEGGSVSLQAVLLVRPAANQAGVAPASA